MAVNLKPPAVLLPVEGVRTAVVRAGIRYRDRPDLALVELAAGARCAAVLTRNAFCAAPVVVTRRHLAEAAPRYLLINSGNANAGNGEQGLADAIACCRAVARATGCETQAVLPFSTGVIGQPLPVDRITAVLPGAVPELKADGWFELGRAIMTTDTVLKGASRQFAVGGETLTVTGVAKGAGMIRPDMATMLAFLATDAAVAPDLLQRCLEDAVGASFNRISVDGDTSTNDACVLIATGTGSAPLIDRADSEAYRRLAEAVLGVCTHLAQAVVRDGEGATKFITVDVREGAGETECLAVAYAIAHSPLVKTAFFASDPNWGRILAAVGRAGVHGLDIDGVRIYLGEVCIVENGGRAASYTEEQGQAVMKQDEICVRVLLGRGRDAAQVWTTDLSYDYVRINAEYRT
jgi:glutamate N-acetyltransferase/amino-acid N-acetyltransferase